MGELKGEDHGHTYEGEDAGWQFHQEHRVGSLHFDVKGAHHHHQIGLLYGPVCMDTRQPHG